MRLLKGVVLVLALAALPGCEPCGGGGTSPSCERPDENRPPPPPPPPPPSTPARVELPIPGVFQETAVWCWAAVSEMVLRFYGHPNLNFIGDYQCGVVNAAGFSGLLPPTCYFGCNQPQCVVTIGSASRLMTLLQQYQLLAGPVAGGGRLFTPQFNAGPISFEQIRTLVSQGSPVMAGITTSGIPVAFGPQHVALIVGYDTTVPGGRGLLVNDPFPYGIGPLGPFGDPYLQKGAVYVSRGRYLIDYLSFTQGLAWTETILVQ